MTSPDSAAPNLRELSRNACVPCRSKKVRCLQSSEEGVCDRCRRMRVSCEKPPPRGPRRPKAPKPPPSVPVADDVTSRIQRLEQSLQHVTSELANAHRASETPRMLAESISSYSSPAAGGPAPPRSNPGITYSGLTQRYDDVIDRGILNIDYAEVLAEEFKIMARTYPYVILPEQDTVIQLRRSSPMLLLAVFVVASWRDRALQITLDEEFLARTGTLMLLGGEHTVELLQSLVVYLSWTHFHMKSTYRHIYLAAGIVVNLGLDRRPVYGARQRMAMRFDFTPPSGSNPGSTRSREGNPSHVIAWSPDAKRAYIGLYVLSKSYSLVIRKSDAIKYSSLLEEYAVSLANEALVPSDPALVHWVRLIRYTEEVSDMFGYSELSQTPKIPEQKLIFIIKAFEARLSALWSNIPISLAGDVALGYNHLSYQVWTYEVILHNLIPTQPLSSNQAAFLIDCLTGLKSILDIVGSLPDRQLQSMCGFSWARMHYLLYLASELTLGIDSPSWSITAVRQILCLETYIDEFCGRLDTNALLVNADKAQGNWFQALSQAWRNIRLQYVNGLQAKGIIVQQQSPVPMSGVAPDGIPVAVNSQFIGAAFTDFNVDFMPREWFGNGGSGQGY